MGIQKPFPRTYRASVGNDTEWDALHGTAVSYYSDPIFAKGQSYTRYFDHFEILLGKVKDLFQYIAPCDKNLGCYSYNIQDLLVQTCIEIENNFKQILLANNYTTTKKEFNMEDYKLVEFSHFLSEYSVYVDYYNDSLPSFSPFKDKWHLYKKRKNDKKTISNFSLDWWDAYTGIKHDAYNNFSMATLGNLLMALSALAIILVAQFYFDYRKGSLFTNDKGIFPFNNTFLVSLPIFKEKDKYSFNWLELRNTESPTDNFPYGDYLSKINSKTES